MKVSKTVSRRNPHLLFRKIEVLQHLQNVLKKRGRSV